MWQFLKQLCSDIAALAPTAHKAPAPRRIRLQVEGLEDRMLLSYAALTGRQGARRPRKARFRPELEYLETRAVPSATRSAILDFDGAYLTVAEMDEGGWRSYGLGDRSVAGFRSLFNSSNPGLDVNGDAVVDGADANLAIDRIVAKVKAHYAPYDLNIFTGRQDDHQSRLTDAVVGDVMVIITGDHGFFPYGGVAPYLDLGNEQDETVFVFGGNLYLDSADRLINSVAKLISHEMGHAFGLGHPNSAAEHPDAVTHHIMFNSLSGTPQDRTHYFNFQDLTYQTDNFTYNYRLSAKHPEFNTTFQNAHQLLSHPDVLGPSPNPWLAVLKPGELTIMGNDAANTITVNPGAGNQWIVTIDGVSTILDASMPGLESINPFATPLTRINVFGNGGDDTITIHAALTAAVVAEGGAGNDLIEGGSGNDMLTGGAGDDRLFGHGGNDVLSASEGNDLVEGGDDFDTLRVDDQQINSGQVYTLTASMLTRTGGPTVTYAGVETLVIDAGRGDDAFHIASTAAGLAVILNAGDGSDTLIGPDESSAWNLTGANAGFLAGFVNVAFSSVENLRGGSLQDRFIFANGMGISGTIDGGGGPDTLDYSAYASAVAVNLATGSATGVAGGVRNIENVSGGAGNDSLTGDTADNILKGNGGSDTLSGQAGSDILLGASGADRLNGDAGRDLIIGGLGADTLNGGAGDDLLIAGTTAFDLSDEALAAIMAEWRSNQTYQARINYLRNGGGFNALNGTFITLTATTVFDDAAADLLTGSTEQDWFWATLTGPNKDRTDGSRTEQVN